MEALLCAGKWVVGFLALPGALVAALFVAGLILITVSFLIDRTVWVFKRVTPGAYTRVSLWAGQAGRHAPFAFFGVVMLAYCTWTAPLFVQGIFGCDECLPEAQRKACAAQTVEQLAEQEVKDRETFEALRAKYGW